jgi:hypothetical protein
VAYASWDGPAKPNVIRESIVYPSKVLPCSIRRLAYTADAITAAVLHIVYGNLSSVDVVAGVNGNTAAAYELLVFCRPYPRPIQTYGCICVL